MMVPISEITLDASLQPRETMHQETIDEYAEQYEADSSKMPALVAFRIDGKIHLVDGFHRIEGAKKAGLHKLDVECVDGNFQAARRFICSANATHGLRRTTADKRRQVEIALEIDPEWSNRKIAQHCGVDEGTVRNVRKSVSAEFPQTAERQAIRGGSAYTMDTTGIGRSPQMAFDTIIPRGDLEERYRASRGGNTKEIPESASDAFDVTSESAAWDRWGWDTAIGLSVEQVREKLTPNSFDAFDWVAMGFDSERSQHVMAQAAQAGFVVYLKPDVTLAYEAPMHPTLEPGELPGQATLPDPVADVAPEPSDWETQITEWLECTGRTQTWYKEILTSALQLEDGDPAVPSGKQVGQVLRRLGWTKDKSQKRLASGLKIVYWRAPERPG